MRIEAARTRLELGKGRIMTKIGSSKKVSGEYRGQVITLSVQAKSVRIAPATNPTGNAPSHRVLIGEAEIGAAWSKRSADDRPSLSVKLDDPSFVAPTFPQPFAHADGEFDLVWSLPARRSAAGTTTAERK